MPRSTPSPPQVLLATFLVAAAVAAVAWDVTSSSASDPSAPRVSALADAEPAALTQGVRARVAGVTSEIRPDTGGIRSLPSPDPTESDWVTVAGDGDLCILVAGGGGCSKQGDVAAGRSFTASRPGNSITPAQLRALQAGETPADMPTPFDETARQVLRGIVPDGVIAVVPVDENGRRLGATLVRNNLFKATVSNAVGIDHVEFVR